MSQPIPVGIFAGSSVVPQIEFRAGVEHLRKNGFEPRIQSQVSAEEFIFPGSDADRAKAFYDLAVDPNIPVLWAARGGYGATRLIPHLDIYTYRGRPKSKKLLVGYSDVTVLHEFVRQKWGWSTLHAPMPAASNFDSLDPAEWNAIVQYVRGGQADPPWQHATLNWLTDPPAQPIRAPLVGGNLSLWTAMAGTSLAARPPVGKIIFLEDVGEAFYRIDRMIVQLHQSGAFDGAAAIVLGDFTNCNDEDNQCLADPATGAKKSLRKVYQQPEAFQRIFGDLGKRVGVPVAQGLPVGHGPNYAPLPLGATYELTPAGTLQLLEWDWLGNRVVTV
jgi:muramoyltetrapeptide carboxypeptidase